MNCPRCNTALAPGSRFCGTCGYAFADQEVNGPGANLKPDDTVISTFTELQAPQPAPYSAPPVPSINQSGPGYNADAYRGGPAGGNWQQPQVYQSTAPANWQQAGNYQQQQPVPQPNAYPQAQSFPGVPQQLPDYPARPLAGQPQVRRKRRGRGCLLSFVITLLILLGLVLGTWFIGVRPRLHDLAENQISQAFDEAQVQILLFQNALTPDAQIIRVSESSMNDYLSLHDTNELQHLQMTVAPTGINVTFTAYGFSCAVQGVPIASNGDLQISNVQEQGLLGLIITSDDIASIMNSHFHDIRQQIHRTVQQVTLKDHEMDIQLSARNG